MAWMEPLTANLLDLLFELREQPVPLTIGGGFVFTSSVCGSMRLTAHALLTTAHAAGHERPGPFRPGRRALRPRKHGGGCRRPQSARLRGRARGEIRAVEEAHRLARPGPRDQGRSARRSSWASSRALPRQRRPVPAPSARSSSTPTRWKRPFTSTNRP